MSTSSPSSSHGSCHVVLPAQSWSLLWLVEAKQSVIENMAPVLTRLFTPLFTVVLVTFLGTMLWTGAGDRPSSAIF